MQKKLTWRIFTVFLSLLGYLITRNLIILTYKMSNNGDITYIETSNLSSGLVKDKKTKTIANKSVRKDTNNILMDKAVNSIIIKKDHQDGENHEKNAELSMNDYLLLYQKASSFFNSQENDELFNGLPKP